MKKTIAVVLTRAPAVEIESEGAVLLKNEDHVLPLGG